jgi:hypothetical protein
MHRLVGLLRRGQALSLATARNSQALVIVAVDRVARKPASGATPIGRVWAAQLNVAGILVGEPLTLADEGYQHVQRLVELHREFAQRLFEAFDTRDLLTASNPATSNVIQMPSRFGS